MIFSSIDVSSRKSVCASRIRRAQQPFPTSQRSAVLASYSCIVSSNRRSPKPKLWDRLFFFFLPHCFFNSGVHKLRSCNILFIPLGLPVGSSGVGRLVSQRISPLRKTID